MTRPLIVSAQTDIAQERAELASLQNALSVEQLQASAKTLKAEVRAFESVCTTRTTPPSLLSHCVPAKLLRDSTEHLCF